MSDTIHYVDVIEAYRGLDRVKVASDWLSVSSTSATSTVSVLHVEFNRDVNRAD